MRRLVRAAVSAVVVVSIPLTLGTLATAHLVVPWVLGSKYSAAVHPVWLVSGFLLAAPFASLLSGNVLYAQGRHRSCLASATVGATATVVFSLALVRPLGLAGVCVAFVLGELAVAVTAYFLIPDDLHDLWKNPMIAVATVSGLLMVAAVRIASSYTSRPLIVVTTGALVYFVVVFILGRKLLFEQFGEAK